MDEQAAVGRINPRAETASSDLRLALFEPDRPHNLGMVLRLGACLGVAVDVIEPCGFPLDDRRIKKGALDYGGRAAWRRHASLGDFLAFRAAGQRRLVLLSTRAGLPYHRAVFRGDDVLMLGRESAGVPDSVHELADLRVRVPLRPGLRSLNVATAAAIVVGEALRQTGELDRVETDSGAAGER
jgi:tRNA (cytidine/uridine-2'-O-)-methyltransferase